MKNIEEKTLLELFGTEYAKKKLDILTHQIT